MEGDYLRIQLSRGVNVEEEVLRQARRRIHNWFQMSQGQMRFRQLILGTVIKLIMPHTAETGPYIKASK